MVAVCVVVSVCRTEPLPLDLRRCAANVQRRGSAQCHLSKQREVAQPSAATWTSSVSDPCRWSSRSLLLLRVCPLPAPWPSCSSHHPWREEYGSWALLEQKRNVGSGDCSRQAGNHENIIVHAVSMKECLSHGDVVRSFNKLCLVVSGCVREDDTWRCPRCSLRLCGHVGGTLKKCTARKLIISSWYSSKVCSPAHQSFMFANDEAFQKVVNGTAAENLGACH